MTPKLCRDCKWFAPSEPLVNGHCLRPWVNLINGEAFTVGMKVQNARQYLCGVTGEGWQRKDEEPKS